MTLWIRAVDGSVSGEYLACCIFIQSGLFVYAYQLIDITDTPVIDEVSFIEKIVNGFALYKEPKLVPAGTYSRVVGAYDSSTQNPANPDPERTVPRGQRKLG
ncbi:MAG: hypothetical protein KJN90_04945 [Gammaproteobacteria bacterium]|nr:hypothetical protein [Gammaproteobacteria bacterium]